MNTEHAGELVRKRRAILGIDQATLSKITGVAIHTISNIEAGRGNPTVKTLGKVLGAVGMELRIEVKS